MTDSLAAEVRRLRTEEQLSVRQIQARTGIGKDRARAMLRGVPPPAWTRRPNAKDELRDQAERLRLGGLSIPVIAERLGISRSTAYLWLRHLPLDANSAAALVRRRAHSKAMTDARWSAHREARDAARQETIEAAAAWVKQLRYRELIAVGAAIYWAEGAKAKPWRPNDCRVRFVNSDPMLIGLFLRFAGAMGVDKRTLRYRVSIHESADPAAAACWWAEQVGVSVDEFQPTALKRHNPGTNRHNTGIDYRGCLVVEVLKSTRLYWKIEGIMKGMSDGVAADER
ncbi:helix-turn-helix domain-containing protein [Micromonospora sp. WMMD1155]|uniref:helix-turn-helix domain-containing protein n=1 Tax=Micromonospora sp. WMMD1155 TaxID=3016094 RepID=UPI00249C86F0|nr:helix-turn-helix domain-containing protein [Micromonospora sp. WMMD1155]WFE50375.1 helix-turn-helix domain-containing protein [Micromonospora sp. WMMD1155]